MFASLHTDMGTLCAKSYDRLCPVATSYHTDGCTMGDDGREPRRESDLPDFGPHSADMGQS